MTTNEPTAEQIQQARKLLSFEDKSVRLSPIALVARLLSRAERAEAKLLKPSPISYDDLIQCPEKCAEYLKLHDAIIEDDDGIRTCADGTKRQTDRRLGYSLCWPHGVMLIGHKGCYPRAEKWAALFIYFWKYHKVPCDVLDEMLGELTGIHYVMEQRDEAIATAKEAHARIGAAIARAERAERLIKEGWVRANVITGKGERTPEAAVSDLVHLYQRESERAKRAERGAKEAKARVSFLESELAKSGYRYADSPPSPATPKGVGHDPRPTA